MNYDYVCDNKYCFIDIILIKIHKICIYKNVLILLMLIWFGQMNNVNLDEKHVFTHLSTSSVIESTHGSVFLPVGALQGGWGVQG